MVYLHFYFFQHHPHKQQWRKQTQLPKHWKWQFHLNIQKVNPQICTTNSIIHLHFFILFQQHTHKQKQKKVLFPKHSKCYFNHKFTQIQWFTCIYPCFSTTYTIEKKPDPISQTFRVVVQLKHPTYTNLQNLSNDWPTFLLQARRKKAEPPIPHTFKVVIQATNLHKFNSWTRIHFCFNNNTHTHTQARRNQTKFPKYSKWRFNWSYKSQSTNLYELSNDYPHFFFKQEARKRTPNPPTFKVAVQLTINLHNYNGGTEIPSCFNNTHTSKQARRNQTNLPNIQSGGPIEDTKS